MKTRSQITGILNIWQELSGCINYPVEEFIFKQTFPSPHPANILLSLRKSDDMAVDMLDHTPSPDVTFPECHPNMNYRYFCHICVNILTWKLGFKCKNRCTKQNQGHWPFCYCFICLFALIQNIAICELGGAVRPNRGFYLFMSILSCRGFPICLAPHRILIFSTIYF